MLRTAISGSAIKSKRRLAPLPSDAVVVYGPHGCGKTTHASRLAAHYGKSRIVDDWTPGGRLDADTLALTSQPHQGAIDFLDAASEAGIALVPGTVQRMRAAPAPQTIAPGPVTVDQLMAATFDRHRTERSDAYKQGVRAVFALRIEGTPIPKRYVPSTTEFDAFHAGVDEGHRTWAATQHTDQAAA